MPRINFRVSDEIKAGVKEICDHYGIDMSELFRGLARRAIDENEEFVPDHLVAASKMEQSKMEHSPYQELGHFVHNFREYVREQLDRRYPQHPDWVRQEYYEHYRGDLETILDGEHERRFITQLDAEMDKYEAMHPETKTSDERAKKAVMDYAVSVRNQEDMDAVREFVGEAIRSGVIPEAMRDEVLDTVRQMKRDEWEGLWDDAVYGELEAKNGEQA